MTTTSIQDPALPPPDGRCPFFQNTPREIRDLIYEAVCVAAPRLFFRKWQFQEQPGKPSGQKTYTLLPISIFGQDLLPPKHLISWRTSLMGALLVNEAFSSEFLNIMYHTIWFHFDEKEPDLEFLRSVPPRHLEKIRRIATVCPVDDDDPSADQLVLWRKMVRMLRNVEQLEVTVNVKYDYKFIAPHYRSLNQPEWSLETVERLPWVRNLETFHSLPHLTSAKIYMLYRKNDEDIYNLMRATGIPPLDLGPFSTEIEKDIAISARWGAWYEALHDSCRRAIGRMLEKEGQPWKEYMGLLKRYHAWRKDPFELTGLFGEEGKRVRFLGERALI